MSYVYVYVLVSVVVKYRCFPGFSLVVQGPVS